MTTLPENTYCHVAFGHDFHGPYPDLSVDAAIHNAGRILERRERHGSFAAWLDDRRPLTKPAWVELFKKTFRFTGGEITGEFLVSTGYLPGAHHPACPVYRAITARSPRWMQ